MASVVQYLLLLLHLLSTLFSTGAYATCGHHRIKSNLIDVRRLKTRYLRGLPISKIDWPKHHVVQYVRLALIEKTDVTIRDKSLNDITKLTLLGEVDKILKKKEPLGTLKDIFHYQNKPCPRLILIIGGPGEY